ncbi:vitamin K epoxide reductase family protein [Candidatus Kaiserbacteria bacterium]|nr:vitamin K epoxide reductase family protein [Candidatus Kaiserbacteria bacterium]
MKRIGVVAILVLAFCGIADSAYLTQHELSGTPLLCNTQGFSDCNTVAESKYSDIFGIPIAEFGLLFYSTLFILAALELVLFDQLLRRVLQGLSFVGVIASLYFTFVQVSLISAFCIYCIVSAFLTLLILLFATLIEPIKKKASLPSVTVPPSPPNPHLRMPPAV